MAVTAADLRALADEIDADLTLGWMARLLTCAILRGLAAKTERGER
jgi:hypothetical protein